MEQRLEDLRVEYERGLSRLAELDAQRRDVHRTLLRISGAIQVLEELLDSESAPEEQPQSLHAVGA